MIFTSCYKNCHAGDTISMSSDGGKSVDYEGETLLSLSVMQFNVKCPSNEDIIEYVKRYYKNVLSKHDIHDMFQILNKLTSRTIGNVYREGTILLDYEEPAAFSNRHIIAAWLELYYGFEVPEIIIEENFKFKRVKKNRYYPIIKGTLETLIKMDIDMHGFNSIAAAFMYERSFGAPDEPIRDKPWLYSKTFFIDMANQIEKKYNEEHKHKSL